MRHASSVPLVCWSRLSGREAANSTSVLVWLVLGGGYRKYNGVGAGSTLHARWSNRFQSGVSRRMPARCPKFQFQTSSSFSLIRLNNARLGAVLSLGTMSLPLCPQDGPSPVPQVRVRCLHGQPDLAGGTQGAPEGHGGFLLGLQLLPRSSLGEGGAPQKRLPKPRPRRGLQGKGAIDKGQDDLNRWVPLCFLVAGRER